MKTHIYLRIIATIVAIISTCITIPSCVKITENERQEAETARQEASYVETILKAAADCGAKLASINKTKSGTTFIFSEPFDYIGKVLDEVYLPVDNYYDVSETKSFCRILFIDRSTVNIDFSNDIRISVNGKEASSISYVAYAGEAETIPFTASSDRGELMISAKSEDGMSKAEAAYDAETKEGYVTLWLDKAVQVTQSSTVSVTFFDGHNKETRYILAHPAYCTLAKENEKYFNVTLAGNKGEQISIEDFLPYIHIQTNLSEVPQLCFHSNEEWISAAGSPAAVLDENAGEYDRTGKLMINDEAGHFEPCVVKVTQIPLPPAAIEGCVAFNDWNLKRAIRSIADKDGDGEVSFDEALAVEEIDISDRGVRDITGIGAFKNAWKFDAHDNDIVDATEITGMRMLSWLNLNANPRLKTFDVRGCTNLFDFCEFDMTSMEGYYITSGQPGIHEESDMMGTKCIRVPDPRKTQDWSRHKNPVMIKQHTKGKGKLSLVLASRGWIDEDIKDGSYKRWMRDMYDCAYTYSQAFRENLDYIDVYYFEFCATERDRWGYEKTEEVLKENLLEYEDLVFSAYEAIYPNIDGDIYVYTDNIQFNPQSLCGFFVAFGEGIGIGQYTDITRPHIYEISNRSWGGDDCSRCWPEADQPIPSYHTLPKTLELKTTDITMMASVRHLHDWVNKKLELTK